MLCCLCFFFFKQKTAYEMRISDWSSDVCSSDLEMLQGLVVKPTHVLVNMVPLHPRLDYFTLQNMGIAICPYRVMCLTDFVREMLALGYEQVDHWELSERHLQVPFEPSGTIDCYHGFYFRLIGS